MAEQGIAEAKAPAVVAVGGVNTPPTPQPQKENINASLPLAPTPTPIVQTPIKQEPKKFERDGDYGVHFGNKVRIGSRKIKIIQLKKSGSMLPKSKEAAQIRDEVIKKIGSQWKPGSKDVIRGLTPEEEIKYLPEILGISSEHQDFITRVKEYWYDFGISVPADPHGITLEAGFEYTSRDLGNEEAKPINIEDYTKYNFAILNSKVCNEGEDNPITYDFRIIDTDANDREQVETFKIKKKIDVLYLNLIGSKNPVERAKIDWIIETIGGPTKKGESVTGMTDTLKEMKLEEIKNRDLGKFSELIRDENLQTKALIAKCITYRLLSNDNELYILNSKVIGNNLEKAIAYINDPNNSQERVILQHKLTTLLN